MVFYSLSYSLSTEMQVQGVPVCLPQEIRDLWTHHLGEDRLNEPLGICRSFKRMDPHLRCVPAASLFPPALIDHFFSH
ncbi:hypothetical protein COCON_G00050700 [Conger conger]|uniref:Uncharacterized protein n=1 Tax=Conger conger TaxID=82655 RepID=A0A9Q1DVK3_CONCO|nr:hypothetical protein COCON_G00050700 [Conger conger]